MSKDKLLEWLKIKINECDNNITVIDNKIVWLTSEKENSFTEHLDKKRWQGQKGAFQAVIDKIVLNQTQDT